MDSNRACAICGFKSIVHKHHIIKVYDFGSDEENNLVDLCPNHHWVADFGQPEDRIELLNLIKNITGKSGSEIDYKERLDEMIFAKIELDFGRDIDKEDLRKNSFNYDMYKKILLKKNPIPEEIRVREDLEIYYLIHLLKKKMHYQPMSMKEAFKKHDL